VIRLRVVIRQLIRLLAIADLRHFRAFAPLPFDVRAELPGNGTGYQFYRTDPIQVGVESFYGLTDHAAYPAREEVVMEDFQLNAIVHRALS
jgi:hypothetical protein